MSESLDDMLFADGKLNARLLGGAEGWAASSQSICNVTKASKRPAARQR